MLYRKIEPSIIEDLFGAQSRYHCYNKIICLSAKLAQSTFKSLWLAIMKLCLPLAQFHVVWMALFHPEVVIAGIHGDSLERERWRR